MPVSMPGIWWNPNRPESRVPGTLILEKDRWVLDLIGDLPFDHEWTSGLSLVPPTTIFGTALGRRYTVRHAFLRDQKGPSIQFHPQGTEAQEDDPSWQQWSGDSLLQGACNAESTLYKSAIFELTGLGDWWNKSGLAGDADKALSDYEPPAPEVIACGNGVTLRLGAAAAKSWATRARSLDERVGFEGIFDSGLTFADIERNIINPLRILLSVVTKTPVKRLNVRLQPMDAGGYLPYSIEVDPGLVASDQPRVSFPTFTADKVELKNFIPGWLQLAQQSEVAFAVAETHELSGSLPMLVVETVNAAETLHRSLTLKETADYPFADRVKEELRSTALNSDERRKVCSSVKLGEISLERRLRELAEPLGESFCAWFFGNQMAYWARISATIRNALSHGYRTTHAIEKDRGALFAVLYFTRATIRLRLMCEAGLPSGDGLIDILMQDESYLAIVRQDIADWHSLVSRIDKHGA